MSLMREVLRYRSLNIRWLLVRTHKGGPAGIPRERSLGVVAQNPAQIRQGPRLEPRAAALVSVSGFPPSNSAMSGR